MIVEAVFFIVWSLFIIGVVLVLIVAAQMVALARGRNIDLLVMRLQQDEDQELER